MVRIATLADAVLLAPLVHALAVEEGYENPPALDGLAALIQTLIVEQASDFFIATQHDAPIGCLQLAYRRSTWSVARYGYIEDFYLLPPMRSQGVGSALLEIACAHARTNGCAYVDLDVRAENSGARRLYERHGFRRSSSELWRYPLAERIT